MSEAKPEILYKYANWSDKHHKRIITHNELYFASAKLFNDPFDCDIPFRDDLRNENDILEIIKQLLRKNHPKWGNKDIDREAIKILAQKNWEREENKKIAEELRIQYMFQRKRILSLTEFKDNILMWSHYANSHKGFCVGIDIEQTENYFNKYCDDTKCPIFLCKVKYMRLFPVLIPGPDNDPKIVIEALTTKAEDWIYEQEWRYILTLPEALMTQKDCILNIPDGIIAEIYLGCEMPEEHKNEIIKLVRAKSVRPRLFTATKSKDSFSLRFDEVLI